MHCYASKLARELYGNMDGLIELLIGCQLLCSLSLVGRCAVLYFTT